MQKILNEAEQQYQSLSSSQTLSKAHHYQNEDHSFNLKSIAMYIFPLTVLLAIIISSNRNRDLISQRNDLSKRLYSQLKNSEQIIGSNQEESYFSTTVRQVPMNVTYNFSVPKLGWVYSDEIGRQNTFVQKCLENIQYFTEKSSYKTNIFDESNAKNWIAEERFSRLSKILSQLQRNNEQKIRDNFRTIKKQLISLEVLYQNGGVLMDKNVVLTENLSWIETIHESPYLNRGNKSSKPQFFTFFEINQGSALKKANKPYTQHDYERYLIQYPGIETFFIAGVPKGEYIKRVLEQYYKILQDNQYLSQVMSIFNLSLGVISPNDVYSKGIVVASHIALHYKQFEIYKSFANPSAVNQFAIDYFGLISMNCKYFPKKMNRIFDSAFEQKIYHNLAFYTVEQLQQNVGPLRYLASLLFEWQLSERLKALIQEKSNQPIHPQSFIAKYLFLNVNKDKEAAYFQKPIQRPTRNLSAPRWQALPKIVWFFWDKGIKNGNMGVKLCLQSIVRSASKAGFEVRQINNSNIEAYIGKELNERFDSIIRNHKVAVFPPTKSNFVRKAIIHKYGGVYLDVSYIALESLDWVLDIAQYPSQYVFNRYGALPKVLMFFHPHYGQPFRWTFDEGANTKRMELTAYENNFIIAEPNQALLGEWIEEYARFITSPYEETKRLMEQYHVKGDSWTNDNDVYLASMDSLKNVIGRKQNELNERAKDSKYDGPRSSAQFYGVWSISGLRGQQKIRINTNFDNSYYVNPYSSDNVFFYRYSQQYTQGILGKVNEMVKLYNWSIRHLNQLIERQFDFNFTRQIHPQSICMKYLISPVQSQITKSLELIYLKN